MPEESLRADRPDFNFESDGYSGDMRVVSFSGHESISELFSFGIEFASPDGAIDFPAVVGAKAAFTLHYTDGERVIRGLVSRFEQGVATERHTPYFVELVPRVWLLTQRYDCRIFQEKDAKVIIKEVLEGAGFAEGDDFKLSIVGSLPKRTYCVQYRETDWNFISRLMEEEGVFYFFEHTADATKLVLANTPQSHPDIDGKVEVPFHPPSSMIEVEEYVYDIRFSQQVRTGKLSLKDYNFTTPALGLLQDKKYSGEAAGDESLEIYDYPGIYEIDDNGKRLSEIRLQAVLARKREIICQSVCKRTFSGSVVKIVDGTRVGFDGTYVITMVQHQGTQPVGEAAGRYEYKNTFRAIPKTVPFRPTRVTPKPIVEGVQTAIVTGPAGDEIYTDKYGRVKVQFPWDRVGQKNEKTSCWVRVAQLWAGEGWGAMFIPRIGHEVIVDFLEGDPDRPIITGRVYNAINMPPYGLDAEKTKSTIKSNSTKGGGGSNEYRFEDKKGSEEIYQHAQKDLTIRTENDKNQSTGHDETLKIGNDRSKKVGNNESTKVGKNRTEDVGADETITINGNRAETVAKNEAISIQGNRSETVSKNETVTIDGTRTVSVGKDETASVAGSRSGSVGKNESITVSGDKTESVDKGLTQSITKDMKQTVGQSFVISVGKNFSCTVKDAVLISSDKEITLKCGDASIVMKKDGTISIKGKDIKVKGSGAIDVKADKNVTMKGQKILQN